MKWMKQCRQIFRDLSLSRKMILTYLVFTGIFCVMSLSALQLSLGIYDSKLYEKSQQELEFFIQQVNAGLEDVEQLSYDAALDTQIQEHLAYMNSLEYLSMEYSYEMQRLREMLTNKIMLYPDVKNVIFTDRKQVSMTIGMDCGKMEEHIYESLLKEFQEKRGEYAFYPPTDVYPYMMSGRDILEKRNASLDYLGTLVFHTDIAGIIERKNGELEEKPAAMFVYAEQGMIYKDEELENVPKLPNIRNDKGYQIIRYQGRRYFLCYQKSAKTGWMYVNLFNYSEIFGQTQAVRYLLVSGFVLIFLITLLVLRYVSNVITKPLKQLSESMKIVETGDFKGAAKVLPEECRQDEVGELSQEFQIMLRQIDVLIHENYEKQLLLKDTKYRMLQAQINPHFLYNTLNALTWMLRTGRNEDAGKMIVELGNLLRAAFAKELYTTVEEEVRTVMSYITIQQFRYGKRAEFIVEQKGNPGMYQIPRMILQPLVENAIHYGLEAMLECCTIKIAVEEEEHTICLTVSDTGVGMTEEELKAVREFTFRPKGHGIGLKNIRERLKMTDEDSEFVIDSKAGAGTSIRMRIVKKRIQE